MAHRFLRLSRASQAYISIVVCAGVLAVSSSVYELATSATPWTWTLLALLTLISGSATIKLPALPATITVSETFVFTSVLLFGPAAGTLTVALDALIISFWSYKRGHAVYKVAFNLFALPLTIFLASHVFFLLARVPPLHQLEQNAQLQMGGVIVPLIVLALAYFLLNSWLIAFAIALEKNVPVYQTWRQHFLWVSLNYFAGASVAALLVTYTRDLDYTYLFLILPLVLILYLTYSTAMGRVADANHHLEQLNRLYLSTVETLAMAIDAKDQITHGHIRRVQTYAVALARSIGIGDEPQIKAIEAAALLHDMGKLAVPEYILNKPGPLTPAEFSRMKLHASVGAEILSAVEFPYPVVPIVRHHHENWDGTGYPDGLCGTDIPIGARVLSVVDCFDALTSDRPYRPKLSDDAAVAILLERRGTMYDPLVVDTFIRTFRAIHVPESSDRVFESTTDDQQHASEQQMEPIIASTEETAVLFELARVLASQPPYQQACEVIASRLRKVVPYASCLFFSFDGNSEQLVCSHASGLGASYLDGLSVPLGQGLSGWAGAHRRTVRNSDPVLELGETARANETRLRSGLSVPVVDGDALIGVITLYSQSPFAFSARHQDALEIVAKQVAPTLKRKPSTVERSGSHNRFIVASSLEQFANAAAEGIKQLTGELQAWLLDVRWPASSPEIAERLQKSFSAPHGIVKLQARFTVCHVRGTRAWIVAVGSESQLRDLRDDFLSKVSIEASAGIEIEDSVVPLRPGSSAEDLLASANAGRNPWAEDRPRGSQSARRVVH